MKRSKIIIVAVALAVMLMAGCSDDSTDTGSSVTIVSETTVTTSVTAETDTTAKPSETAAVKPTPIETMGETTLVNNDFKEPEPEDIVKSDNGDSYVKDQILICAVPGTSYDDIVKLGEKFSFTVVGFSDDDYQAEFQDPMTYDELCDAIDELEKEDIVDACYLNGVYEADIE